MSDNEDFHKAADAFTLACMRGAAWKTVYPGASYFTRMEAAYNAIGTAWADVRAPNMSPADRTAWKRLLDKANGPQP